MVEVMNRFKALDLGDRVPKELWMEYVDNTLSHNGPRSPCKILFFFYLKPIFYSPVDVYSAFVFALHKISDNV